LVIEHFYPMQVIAVRRGQLVINIGSSGSHKTGDRYDIVIQEAFEDPQTGDVIFDEQVIGTATIGRISPSSTRAEPDNDSVNLEEIEEIIAENDEYYRVIMRKAQG
ncbi:MAG: hypothetical protein AAF108_10890, partial [Planctomycetota bacterium]